jgi:hypothetical protein
MQYRPEVGIDREDFAPEDDISSHYTVGIPCSTPFRTSYVGEVGFADVFTSRVSLTPAGLVVRQNQRTHREIENLLEQLRKASNAE